MTFVAMALGAFYVFAGVVVMRSMAMERVMDQVLAALNDPSDANDQTRVAVLSAGAVLTLAGGVALAVLSPLALPFFSANVVVQGGYLLWATRAIPPEDASAATGRAQTLNAFVVYCVVTAFVGWLSAQGYLRPWSAGTSALLIDGGIVAAAVLAAWAFIHMPRKGDGTLRLGDGAVETPLADYRPPPKPTRLRLAPAYCASPLWNDDTREPVSVFALDLPDDLTHRIETWDDMFQGTYNPDDPPASAFPIKDVHDEYIAEGKEIAIALRAVWPGALEVNEQFR